MGASQIVPSASLCKAAARSCHLVFGRSATNQVSNGILYTLRSCPLDCGRGTWQAVLDLLSSKLRPRLATGQCLCFAAATVLF